MIWVEAQLIHLHKWIHLPKWIHLGKWINDLLTLKGHVFLVWS